MHMMVVLFGPLGWMGLTIVGLLLVVLVLIGVIRHQRTRYTSVLDAIGALAQEMDGLDTQLAKLVAQISQARDHIGVPTIGRPYTATERHYHNPQQLSFWQEFMKRARALLSMLNGGIRKTASVPATPADLKLRLAVFQEKLRFEGDNIGQLTDYVSPNHKKGNPPGANVELVEDGVGSDAGSNSIAEAPEYKAGQNETGGAGAGGSETSSDRETARTSLSLVQLYNQAVTNNAAREEFRERFKPLRIGTVNAVERRQNPTVSLAPEFKEASDGDFFAVPLDGETGYAVVPRLGLTIGAVSYNAGALGEIFGNPKYDAARSYSRYCVQEPAIFTHENDRWLKVKPGELELGPPD